MPVVVVTDSSARLPQSLTEQYRIKQVPLHLTLDGVDYREGIDDIPADIIDTPGVTTSGAIPNDLETAFGEAIEESRGDGVVAVHMSRRLSGTWSNARLAAEQYSGQVRVVDSRSVGLAVGFVALAAGQASAAGADRDRVYEAAIREAATVESLLAVQNLDNLRNSGRMSAASKLLGSALSIKPILHTVDGSLVLRERHRTFSKAMAKMLDAAAEMSTDGEVTVGVQHSQAPHLADEVLEKVTARIRKVTSTLVVDLGPVLGCHVGRGAVGVVIGSGLTPLGE
ncbi:DegV family protein [Gordonia sp. TBRC 11910]|uniref:DegV family protein n=1 Tax=Gordonia asplenii TaxID=2725283 RepID=A0A848KXZ0_9ACTN|nr:DegV family protein [Gordonia asplenii]NMO01303.1 DegV family protein [Gordonia asplenii]